MNLNSIVKLAFGVVVCVSLYQGSMVYAQPQNNKSQNFLKENEPKAKVLILGTFHFKDSGLDSYKPERDVDILSKERQRQIEEVVRLLEAYKPTKVAVEVMPERQAWLDSLYERYLSGNYELEANEIFQLGFRLAKRLGHKRVYAVDAKGRSYFPQMSEEEYNAKVNSILETVDPKLIEAEERWEERFNSLYRYEESLLARQTIRENYLYGNSIETLRKHHGHYLIGEFKLGRGDDYFGPDLKTRWYNRNLRIFQNLQRITESPTERILLIIGGGHVPILRDCVESSPEYELIEVSGYLGPIPSKTSPKRIKRK